MKKSIFLLLTSFLLLSFESDTTSSGVFPSLSLEQQDTTIIKGNELKVKPKFSNTDARKKKCTWSSSDTDVAMVKKGIVKTKNAGQTIIKLEAEDGTISDSFVLTVAVGHGNYLMYMKLVDGVVQLFAKDTTLPPSEKQITLSSADNTELHIAESKIAYCRNGKEYFQNVGEFKEYATYPTQKIAFWGDSMTAGTGGDGVTIANVVAKLSGLEVSNNGIGGQSSTSIAIRQGGVPFYLSVENDMIPASETVNIVKRSGQPITNQGDNYINGWLSGVYGTLKRDKEGAYTFARSADGIDVTSPERSEFIVDNGDKDAQICVFWYGRNNYLDVKTVLHDIDASINKLKAQDKKFIVLSVCNGNYGAKEMKGGEAYKKMIALNETLRSKYPKSYIDARRILIDSYDRTSGSDVADYNNDVVPRSLRYDNVHLNARGYSILGNVIYSKMQNMGWLD